MAILNKLIGEISTTKRLVAITSPVLLILGIFVVFEAFVLPKFSTHLSQSQVIETPLPESRAQVQCIDRVFTKVAVPQVDIGTYEYIWNLCGAETFNALYLQDFKIRREKFTRQ